MKLAIQNSHSGFHPRWVKYCEEKNIDFKIVDCYANDIIDQLKDCKALMWHHHHTSAKDVVAAKNILHALNHAGINVFPNFKTGWHFDDKVAQKYLLESLDLPLIPSYVFYSKKEAIDWVNKTSFPKVFKLKGGAGAANVKLIKSKKEARKLARRAFGRGFKQYNAWSSLKDRFRKYKLGKVKVYEVLKGIVRLVYEPYYSKVLGRELGYIYFQEFIPNNNCDYRLKVIDGKCWGLRRMIRKNDFRASGSDIYDWDKNAIPLEMVKIALQASKKLNAQSIAFDFVLDLNKRPLIIEISYGFGIAKDEFSKGYWDSNLVRHEGCFNPMGWLINNIIKNEE